MPDYNFHYTVGTLFAKSTSSLILVTLWPVTYITIHCFETSALCTGLGTSLSLFGLEEHWHFPLCWFMPVQCSDGPQSCLIWCQLQYAVSVVAYDNFYLATPLHLLTMASLGASTPVDFQHCSKVKLGNCSGYFWHFRIEAYLVFCRERLQATKSTRWYRLWLVAMTLKKMTDKRILMNQ